MLLKQIVAIIIIFTTSLPWQEQKEILYVRILIKKIIALPHKTIKQTTTYNVSFVALKCPSYTLVHYIKNNFRSIIQITYSADLMLLFIYIAASPELHQPLTLQYHEKDSLTSLTTELDDEISSN